MEIKGKLVCKKSDNKAFKLGEDWYNVNDSVIPFLEKISKGDFITVQFEKKGISRYVSKLAKGSETSEGEVKTEESSTGFICEVCGTSLKDGRFKKCYLCNKNKATKKEEPEKKEEPKQKEEPEKKEESTERPKSFYGSPEDVEGKEIGCAIAASASAAAGTQFGSPDEAAQWIKIVAGQLLEWIRDNKN
jgi:hypothetical protein